MTKLISVRTSGTVSVATGPAPSTSVTQQASSTISVRTDGQTVLIQKPPERTTAQVKPSQLLVRVSTTSVKTISVNSPAVGVADIIGRKIDNVRAVNEFETMINHDIFLEAAGEILLNGTDAETSGILLLL